MRKACPGAGITVVLSEERADYFKDICRKTCTALPLIAFGGTSRWESVRNGLSSVPESARVILVHDGARPFPSARLIEALLQAVAEGGFDGAVPALPVTDSLRCEYADGTSQAVNRTPLRAVQTPQAFQAPLLKEAYRLPFDSSFTDDASVMEAAGHVRLAITPGEPTNIKVTRPADLTVAEAFIAAGLI